MFKTIALTGMFGLAVLAGCDDNPSADRADNAQDQTKKNVDALKDSAEATGTAVGGEAQRQAEKAADKAGELASDSAKAVTDQAESLFRQAEAAIKDQRWPEAEKLIDQLEALKDRLPPEWQARVEQLRNTLKSARPG
jgi:hypothetical protein